MPRVVVSADRRRIADYFGNTARKSVVALADQAIVSGSNFLTVVIIGRFCGATELGIYSLAFTLLVLIACVADALVWTPFAVHVHRRHGNARRRYAASTLALQIAWIGLVMVSLLVIALLLRYWGAGQSLNAVVWLLLIVVPFHLLREFVRRMHLAELHVWRVFFIDFLVAFLQFTGFAALIYFKAMSAATVCVVIGISCGTIAVTWLLVFARRIPFRRRLARVTMIRHWRFGRWICASQMTDVSQQYCLNWLLLLFMGATATGIYAACSIFVAVFNPVVLGIGNVLLARASQLHAIGGGREVRRVVWKATMVLVATMSGLFLLIVLFAQRMLDTVYGGSDFAGQGNVVAVLALAAFISTLSFPAETGLRVIGRPDLNFKVGILGLGITLCLAVPLILYSGVLGGAIAALVGTAFVSGILVIAFHLLTAD